MKILLRAMASGASVDEAWERSGYASREEASKALDALAAAMGPERPANSGKTLIRQQAAGGAPGVKLDGVVINADGAARGNPGPASAAAVAYLPDGAILTSRAMVRGKKTNNEAEYEAVLLGLDLAADLGARSVRMRLDSELIVKQMSGEYRIKKPHLAELAGRVRSKSSLFKEVIFEHIPRSGNSEADRLANEALDEREQEDD